MKIHALSTFLLASCTLLAQDYQFKDFSFPQNAAINLSEDAYPEEDVITLDEKMYKQYQTEGEFLEYTLTYNKVLIRSDKGQEMYNKIYLSNPLSVAYITEKARVINGNEIIELNENDIKVAVDNENGSVSKYFALENVQVGSIVEYYFITAKPGYVKGTNITAQSYSPTLNYEFCLYTPSYLEFAFKSYNGIEDVLDSLVNEDLRVYYIHSKDMEAFEKESESIGTMAAKSFSYKLEANTSTNKNNIVSYSDVSKNIVKNYNLELDSKGEKSYAKLIKLLPAEFSTKSEIDKIKLIEDMMKNNFIIDSESQAYDIKSMLSTKVIPFMSAMQLYSILFERNNIEYNVVITTNRYERRYDPDFESYSSLSEQMFYFPAHKIYLAPEYEDYRTPYAPYQMMANYGLFIEKVNVGSVVTGLGTSKYIEPLDYTKNLSNMDITVSLNSDDLINSLVTLRHDWTGYFSNGLGKTYLESNEENQEKLREYFFHNTIPDAVTSKLEIVSTDERVLDLQPFSVYGEFPVYPLLDKAGNESLLRIGEIIGPQMEMYTEKKRTLDIDNRYCRTFDRVITINVPDDLVLEGLDALNMNHVMEVDGEIGARFISTYKWDDKNTLVITILEDYRKVQLPIEFYEPYKEVVNAAADFNKIVLVIKKK